MSLLKQNGKTESVVVMTGGTAGIGKQALKHIVDSSSLVIVGVRNESSELGESIALDLASLESVRSFAAKVTDVLQGKKIDVLILNAGAAYRDTLHETEDGFEATFAINHLAHYLLARLLLPNMAENSRLIITTSDVHAHAPEVLDVVKWSTVRTQGAGMQAYAGSKLCNLLTARGLLELPIVKQINCEVIAYNPGLTVNTKLSRNSPKWQRALMNNPILHVLLRLGSYLIPMMYPGTPERAGEALAQLAMKTATPPKGKVYASLVRGKLTYPKPSELACSDEARDNLWQQSAKMLGLS